MGNRISLSKLTDKLITVSEEARNADAENSSESMAAQADGVYEELLHY